MAAKSRSLIEVERGDTRRRGSPAGYSTAPEQIVGARGFASVVSFTRMAFVGSAAGMGALALHATAGGMSGVAVMGGLLLGWSALATTGVVVPSLEVYGHVLLRGP